MVLGEATYRIASVVSIPAGKTLSGAGKGKSIIEVTNGDLGAGKSCVTVAENCHLHDFTIKAAVVDPTTSYTEYAGLFCNAKNTLIERVEVQGFGRFAWSAGDNAEYITFRDCVFTGAYGWGFEVNSVPYVTIESCVAHSNGLDGFKARINTELPSSRENTDLKFTDCRSYDNGKRDISVGGSEPTNGNGFDLYHGNADTTLINCSSNNNVGDGLVMKGNGHNQANVKVIGGNYSYARTNSSAQAASGINIMADTSSGGLAMKLIGVAMNNNNGSGLLCSNGWGVSFIGCSITENKGDGIKISGGVATIDNCTIAGNFNTQIRMGASDSGTFLSKGSSITNNVIMGHYNPTSADRFDQMVFFKDTVDTVVNATDTLTITGNPYVNLDRIHFIGTDLPSGIEANVWYYVRDVSVNDFKLSLTPIGDDRIALADDGSGTINTNQRAGTGEGIRIYSSQGRVSIRNNWFVGLNTDAGSINQNGREVDISENVFYHAIRTAIYVKSASLDTRIRANEFHQADFTSLSWGYIRVEGDRCDIHDNLFELDSNVNNSNAMTWQANAQNGSRSNNKKNANVANLEMIIAGATFRNLSDYLSGSGTPVGVKAPEYLGQEYFDSTANTWWKSTGLTNADWVQISV